MLDIRTIAPNPGFPLVLGWHRFFETADHQLGHEIDGDLRAVVPPEGMRDYAAAWPQCAELVGQLLRGSAAAAPAKASAPGVDAVLEALKGATSVADLRARVDRLTDPPL